MIRTGITLLLWLLVSVGFAQEVQTTKLDEYFNTLEQNDKFMGSVAVSKGGEIVYAHSAGFCSIENGLVANAHSKYRIGSISKTFTATMVLKSVENDLLRLDQTIDAYFPSLKYASKTTIEHLLYHQSGIHSLTDNEDYLEWNTQAKSQEEMLAIIEDGGYDFKPGKRSAYSNSNYVLLSFILEKEYGTSYSELLRELITQPLGLNETYVFEGINAEQNECSSYGYRGSWTEENETHPSIPLGAGSIASTPTDLVRFSEELFTGQILSSKSLEVMKSMRNNYGAGLVQFPFYDEVGYGHTGGIDGFRSILSYFPEDSVAFALTSNGSNYDNNSISTAVLSAVFGRSYDIPEFSSYALCEEDIDKYLGVYASKEIKLKITFTKDGNSLIAQGTGQPKITLEPVDLDKFAFDQAGAVFRFVLDQDEMILFQGGEEIRFTRQ